MERLPQQEVDVLVDELILPFYKIKRDMTVPTEDSRYENDAEHSWSLTVFACSLAERIDPTLDVGLVAQFATIHDLVELYAGDTSVWADNEDLATKQDREALALEIIKERFAAFPWIVETVEAYERMDTNEANYVRAMDKYLAMCIRMRDQGKFYREHGITMDKYIENIAIVREKAKKHEGVSAYLEAIYLELLSHPEYFYQAEEAMANGRT